MEVFHGLSTMEACNTLDGYYPGFSSQKETRTVEDMWSMAFLSGICSDVEHFEDHFQQRTEDRKPLPTMAKVVEQPVYSPPLESPDSFGEQWLIDLLPPDNAYPPPMAPRQDYHSMPSTFGDPQAYQGGGYSSGVVPSGTPDSYPSSPLSNSTLDGSDISDLLDMVEDLKSEPSAMYSFSSCSPPPQAVPELQFPRESTIHSMLTSPPAHFGSQQPREHLSFYAPQLPSTAGVTPKAKDIATIRDVEKLLLSPLSISSSPCAKKRSRSNSKMASKPLEKRLKKKEQNKSAALRYREKKRHEKNGLGLRQESLEQENGKLKDQVDSLDREIGYLKDLLKEVQKRRMQ